MEWKVGDRVKVIKVEGYAVNSLYYKGLQGTVIYVSKTTYPAMVLIEFDEYINGHSGNSMKVYGKHGQCWWFSILDEQYTYGVPTLEEDGVYLERIRCNKKNNYW